MKRNLFYSFILLWALMSCTREKTDKKSIAFYHWKAKADYTQLYDEAIKTTGAQTVYMHYFDIESVRQANWSDDGIYPTYVLKTVNKAYQNLNIIPVVFISNQVFKTENLNINHLANKIEKLIDQISLKHFKKAIKQVQIDCDWSQSTKNEYFELLSLLQKHYELDVTIRLHQIKYQDITGVPPVKKGTLMLYNVGDLKNKDQNSILEASVVKQYINKSSSFPLTLNIALPLFSQTVVMNRSNKVKLIKNTDRATLQNDSHFKQVNPTNFMVLADTLYKGFYLSKGYNLKLEELSEDQIVESYAIIKHSKLKTDGLLFYYLDDASLLNRNLKNTIEKL